MVSLTGCTLGLLSSYGTSKQGQNSITQCVCVYVECRKHYFVLPLVTVSVLGTWENVMVFCCLCAGLCGSPRLLDVGGVPYLMPVPDKTKVYSEEERVRYNSDEDTSVLSTVVAVGKCAAYCCVLAAAVCLVHRRLAPYCW